MQIKITVNDKGNPPGKLADAEIHFTEGPLEGLKLVGFAVWETRNGSSRNVTFPARAYSMNGERRSFALLRPLKDATASTRIRDLILQAYDDMQNPPASTPAEVLQAIQKAEALAGPLAHVPFSLVALPEQRTPAQPAIDFSGSKR